LRAAGCGYMHDEGVTLSELPRVATRRTVGIRHIPLVFLAPGRLFSRVEDVPAWGWPLLVLLTIVTLSGWAMIETGLIDRQVDMAVRANIARIDSMQRDVVERSELRERYEAEYKMGEFRKLLKRMQVVVAEPLKALAVTLLGAAVLYGVVALSGRKAEWHTLLTVFVFAGFVDLLRVLIRLGLMLRFATLEIDTSLAPVVALIRPGQEMDPMQVAAISGVLTGLDPFRIWYWLVVIVGLATTSQLRGWRAWLVCGFCWLVGAAARCGLTVMVVSQAMKAAPPG